MRRFVAIFLVLFLAFGVYWFYFKPDRTRQKAAKMSPMALKKHSPAFNDSVSRLLTAYLEMKDALVEDDTSKAKQSARIFVSIMDSFPLDELKKDTAGIFETAQSNLNDIKANTQSFLVQSEILEMRKDFSMITEMMYPSFFKAINYEGTNLYLQNCPMAFGEDQAANWISNSTEIVNPYLGKRHPEYKATMLHCGEVKDTIKAK